MKISKSLRFRIIAGYVLFTFLTTLCYTLSGLVVLKISDDELFNWHIVRVAEEQFQQYRHGTAAERAAVSADKHVVIGDDRDVIKQFYMHSLAETRPAVPVASLEEWSDVSHISRGDDGRFEIFEVAILQDSFHVVRIPIEKKLTEQTFFYYIVDISGYNKHDVWAVQGTYFGLFMLLLLFMIFASRLGVAISNKVMSPLTQLTQDVEKASVGSNLGNYYPDEVGALAVKINDLMNRIGGFVDREKSFARDVSHELRTPVTSSQIAVELALHVADNSNPKLREILGRICDANRDMMHLIETFMLIGRENIPDNAVSPTSLSAVVNESINKNSYLISGKALETINMVDDSIVVNQPHKLLAVVIDNILRNAFQYTEKGNVTVRASSEYISVADTGRGFDQSAVDRLLRPYETFHGEGVGLGLNIIKRICELTGWRLEVRSECGVGSLLIVHF